MKRFAAALIPFALVACNTLSGQPALRDASIVPPLLYPGDTGIITVEAVDPDFVIERIEGTVRGVDETLFRLRDDGVEPDVEASDGIWTIMVDVPPQAPSGEFTLDFTAYRSDGTPVPVRDDEGEEVPLMETVPFRVNIRPVDAETAPAAEGSGKK